jgi:pantoate--beta-alanine ligase
VEIFETIAELRGRIRAWRAAGDELAFVPTMGALHEGHLSLVRAATRPGARVVASIFVNPLQFAPGEDLSRYPRPFQDDVRRLEGAGVDALFHPPVAEMYPEGSATRVVPGPIAGVLEGASRPGHFTGVATVVARLFGIVTPDRAYFGEKDAQQLAVIRAMVADLAMPVEIVPCATVREPDGLAMSSRNRYLDPEARRAAVALVQALAEAQAMHRAGAATPAGIEARLVASIREHPEVELDYAAVVDPATFRPPAAVDGTTLALLAARVGAARLIDNARVAGQELREFISPAVLPAGFQR